MILFNIINLNAGKGEGFPLRKILLKFAVTHGAGFELAHAHMHKFMQDASVHVALCFHMHTVHVSISSIMFW